MSWYSRCTFFEITKFSKLYFRKFSEFDFQMVILSIPYPFITDGNTCIVSTQTTMMLFFRRITDNIHCCWNTKYKCKSIMFDLILTVAYQHVASSSTQHKPVIWSGVRKSHWCNWWANKHQFEQLLDVIKTHFIYMQCGQRRWSKKLVANKVILVPSPCPFIIEKLADFIEHVC